MKHVMIQRSLAGLLVLSILVVGGLASAQSVSHDAKHAHHQKATHGTLLCSWMCAAGQAGEATTVLVQSEVVPQDTVEFASADEVRAISSRTLAARAPPVR